MYSIYLVRYMYMDSVHLVSYMYTFSVHLVRYTRGIQKVLRNPLLTENER
jgi:hypothetical protein